MDIVLTSSASLLAALCAGVMGFAIQRGATCTVAAVDEVLTKRSVRRLTSLFEASLWVAGSLLVAQALQQLPNMPAGYALNHWTVVGGVLLGLGAFINGACVFGAIARFGSGQWAYLLTPLGFYLGCLSLPALFGMPAHQKLPYGSPVLQAPAWVAGAFLLYVLWRLARPLWRPEHIAGVAANAKLLERARDALASRLWSPHAATIVIGITFFVMLMLVGAWAYTDVLAELARGMANSLAARFMLLLAMLLGAVWGGWTAGRFRSTRVNAAQALKCTLGGVLMGWGSLLIPGGNDGLILVGMPLLWPYAWVAFLTMALSIAAAQWLAKTRAVQAAPSQAS
jgi:toxin CptA